MLTRFLGLAASSLGRRLLGQKHGLDVRQDSSLGNGDAGEQLVELLVVADGQLEMTGNDPGLLVVTGSVAGQLEDLSSQVLHDGGQVHGGTGTNTLGIVTLAEQTVDTAHGELKAGTAGARLALSLGFSSFTTSRHDDTSRCSLYERQTRNDTSGE